MLCELHSARGNAEGLRGEGGCKVHEVVQVADVFAAIFRLNSELADYGLGQKYAGERAHVAERVEQLTPRLLGNAHRWAARSSSDCSAWYSAIAPAVLKAL